jgi:hypothetical protein
MERGRIEKRMSIREDIYQIVGELPESALPSLLRHVKMLQMAETDPFIRALMNAPIDDEPYTDEERAEDAEAWEEYRRGEGRPLKDIRAELLRE